MSIWIAVAMFVCYGFGVRLEDAAQAAGFRWWVRCLVGLPFMVGAYFILSTQVGLHW